MLVFMNKINFLERRSCKSWLLLQSGLMSIFEQETKLALVELIIYVINILKDLNSLKNSFYSAFFAIPDNFVIIILSSQLYV